MQNKITTTNALDPPQNCTNQTQKVESQHWNYFQNSGLLPRGQLFTQTFGSINSFSLKDIDFRQSNEFRLNDYPFKEKENFSYFEDQSPFVVMSFNRGTSEAYEPYLMKSIREGEDLEVELVELPNEQNHSQSKIQKSISSSPVLSDLSGQEFKSNSINSPSNIDLKQKQSANSQAQGFLAKNVTKNIGKLLMKFIWKNKTTLKQKMRPNEQMWEGFLSLIQIWKKENNVTRQFLISKWQSEGEEFKIFRTVAHHFFRKHCLSAILKSNIRSKRIHFQRISKFDQAIVDPTALDYLS